MNDIAACGRRAGEEYDFATAEYVRLFPLDTWILAQPPAPDALLDLLNAQDRYESDFRACAYALLDYCPREPGLEAVLHICRNMKAWDAFWAVRHPSPEWRAMHDRVWRKPGLVAAKAKVRPAAERYCAKRGIDFETWWEGL
jgi:hypothetical protein